MGVPLTWHTERYAEPISTPKSSPISMLVPGSFFNSSNSRLTTTRIGPIYWGRANSTRRVSGSWEVNIMVFEKIPARVLRDVTNYLTDNNLKGFASVEAALTLATPMEIFKWYCEWNGIINWSGDLWDAVIELNKQHSFSE
jgi:hypothetical protein